VNPDIKILSTYASGDFFEGFETVDRGRAVALELYQRGADVILHAAGSASIGAVEAARQHTRDTGTHVWAIAPDSDWSLVIGDDLQAHLLTSAIKKYDVATFEIIRRYTAGEIGLAEEILTLADDAMGLAPSGHLTPSQLATIDGLVAEVIAGTIAVPQVPAGQLLPPIDVVVAGDLSVVWDGETCSYASDTTSFEAGTAAAVELINLTSDRVSLNVFANDWPWLQLPSTPSGTTRGYMMFGGFGGSPRLYDVMCGFDSGPLAPLVHVEFIGAD
jgi:hypothetical protein